MSVITVIAKIKVIGDNVEIVKSELTKLIPPTRSEKGCIDYILYQDNEDPNLLLFYENWESAVELDEHMKTEHFTNCFSIIGDMVEMDVSKATLIG